MKQRKSNTRPFLSESAHKEKMQVHQREQTTLDRVEDCLFAVNGFLQAQKAGHRTPISRTAAIFAVEEALRLIDEDNNIWSQGQNS